MHLRDRLLSITRVRAITPTRSTLKVLQLLELLKVLQTLKAVRSRAEAALDLVPTQALQTKTLAAVPTICSLRACSKCQLHKRQPLAAQLHPVNAKRSSSFSTAAVLTVLDKLLRAKAPL